MSHVVGAVGVYEIRNERGLPSDSQPARFDTPQLVWTYKHTLPGGAVGFMNEPVHVSSTSVGDTLKPGPKLTVLEVSGTGGSPGRSNALKSDEFAAFKVPAPSKLASPVTVTPDGIVFHAAPLEASTSASAASRPATRSSAAASCVSSAAKRVLISASVK